MPAPGQRLSAAELAALERAFAAEPSSDAYRPLAEAYLAMGRFMEAMVVARKGIKTHPSDPAPRLLLGRVHAAQGKDAKAIEELQEALKLAPADLPSLRLLASLQLKGGQREAGTGSLRKAWEAAPDDAETLAVMKKFGVSFATAPTPTPGRAPSPAPAPVTAAGGTAVAPGATPPSTAPGAAAAPAPPAAPQRRATRTAAQYADELASRYATEDHPLHAGPAPRRRRGPLVATVALGVGLALALAGWGIASSVRKAKAVEIDHLLRQSRELIEKDSFSSYQEAARLCERILQRDRDAIGGQAYLAYIDALRWGELGEGEALRAEAQRHLDAVRRLGRPHSHAYAAQAYLTFYGGDSRTAIAALQQVLEGPEGQSPLLRGVLGVLLMQSGDLDGARAALTFARQNAPGDVRAAQMLAEQWRRRGLGYEAQASALYDSILTRLAPDHVPSLLGKAQLLLDGGEPAEALKRVTRVLQLGGAASPRQIAVAHALRGSVLAAQGRIAEGAAEEEQALSLDPTSADVHDLIGRRKLRAGDGAGAVASFERAIRLDPQRIGFSVDLAHALMRRPDGAREAVAALEPLEQRAGNARVTKLLGDAHRSAGDLDRARASYERALSMDPRYPDALVGLAQLEEARGAPASVVEAAYARALDADPQSCPALFWVGRARKDPARLSEYVRLCPKGPHVGEAEQLLGEGRLPKRHAGQRRRR